MPCNTVVTNTVELGNVKDHDLLERALMGEFGVVRRTGAPGAGAQQARFQFTVDGQVVSLEGGRAASTMDSGRLEAVVGRVKQAYAREAVTTAARRFGWTVVRGADANSFQLRKG